MHDINKSQMYCYVKKKTLSFSFIIIIIFSGG